MTVTDLPFLVSSRFGFNTFFSLAVDDYLFSLAKFVHCFLTCKLTCSSAVSHLLHLHIKRKNTRASPIKCVLVLHSFSSLRLNLENDIHSYACHQPIWLRIPAYTQCNTMLTLGQQRLTCFWFSQKMCVCVQALCFLHLLHKSFASLLLGFLSHMPLIDFSFAFTCSCAGVSGIGVSGKSPVYPTTDNTALIRRRSNISSHPCCFPCTHRFLYVHGLRLSVSSSFAARARACRNSSFS